jgi:hypothetical protein
MSDRYILSYQIQITTPQNEVIDIRPPFSMNAQITRNTLASANKCTLTIYNLGETTRSRLYKDRFKTAEYWQLIIKAGYLGLDAAMGQSVISLPTVFQGSIYECSSQKKGHTYETVFDCFDGGQAIQNGFTSRTIAKGFDFTDALKKIIDDMPNTIAGIIGNKQNNPDTSMRGKVFFGNSYDVLTQETNGQQFIDCETVHVLNDNEVLPGEVIKIDQALLRTTPKRREAFLDCELNFFPEAQTKRYCELNSKEKMYNGQYEITGFTHNIVIQGDTCGDSNTMISLDYGALGLTEAV